MGFNQLLDAGIAHADQGELGRHKKGIGRNQQYDRKHPQKNESDHPSAEILT